MGQRGPAPKPAALNNLEGDPGNRRGTDVANPEPRKGAPKPPAWLSGEALAEWGRIVPELEAIGLLSVVDRAALVSYVTSWATFVEASQDISARGTVVEGREGNLVKNPSVATQRDAMAQIKTWCVEFGLSPSARSRMQLPSDKIAGDGDDAAIRDLFAV